MQSIEKNCSAVNVPLLRLPATNLVRPKELGKRVVFHAPNIPLIHKTPVDSRILLVIGQVTLAQKLDHPFVHLVRVILLKIRRLEVTLDTIQ